MDAEVIDLYDVKKLNVVLDEADVGKGKMVPISKFEQDYISAELESLKYEQRLRRHPIDPISGEVVRHDIGGEG